MELKETVFEKDKQTIKDVLEDPIAKKEDMAYDDVLSQLGEFGRYQRRIYFLLCLPAISCAFHKLVGVFLQARVPHRCQLPWEDKHSNYHISYEIVSKLYPPDYLSDGYSQCQVYSMTSINDVNQNNTLTCGSWIYDTSNYESTTLMEWDLVCDRAWLKATADAIFMIGVLLGSIIIGDLSDRYGRRPLFFLSLIFQVLSGIAAGLAPNYIVFVLFRMMVGASTSGVFLVAYVIGLEMVGPQKRMFAGVAVQFFFSTGYILTAAFAYFLRDWRWLQIGISVPGLLFLTYWWFIPESARWLITKGRQAEAEAILMKAAKENKTQISLDSLKTLLKSGEQETIKDAKQPTVLDLFKYKNLRKKSLTIFFLWFVNSATYYGLSWNTGNLAGNEYINFIMSGLVEYPAYIFLLLTLNKWGRKIILCGTMVVAGLALLLNIVVPDGMSWLTVTLAMIGKLAISASYGTVYIYSAEQFPTVIRNVALGACSTFARVGGILAPYINILAEIYAPLPLIIFGLLSVSSVFFAFFLPETHNKKLPDTIEDGEQFGKKKNNPVASQNTESNSLPQPNGTS
ncbi:organic cation transporter isoform X2 [Lycorma delicatula]|uniref:organic cation transporter isoform X2 n=1 Tax=Lycorma delicatula TaxID=130591 RepID=UPI003F519BD5